MLNSIMSDEWIWRGEKNLYGVGDVEGFLRAETISSISFELSFIKKSINVFLLGIIREFGFWGKSIVDENGFNCY